MLGASDKVKRPTWPSWILVPIGIRISQRPPPPDDSTLRVVISTRGDRGLDDEVDLIDMSRCRYFTVVDIVDKRVQNVYVIRNEVSNVPRAAIAVAYWLVEIGANIAIASGYCPNLAYYLDQAGVQRFSVSAGKKVRDCLAELNLIEL